MTEIHISEETNSTEEAERCTSDHMAYLPGVDAEWARQFIEYDQKFHHFNDATTFFFVTPRVVRIGILKPDAVIGLLRKQHQEYCEEEKQDESFEESISMDWEAWLKPMKTSLPIWDLERGLKCYLQGMTPMQALQDIHAHAEDGHENDSIGGGTIMLGPVMAMMAFFMFIIGLFSFYGNVRDQRDHAAGVESSKAVEAMSATHH